MVTSYYGGKLIPTLYKDKKSFNTLNKDRDTFRKGTNDHFHIVVVDNIVNHICTGKCTKYHHVVG